MTFSSTTDTGDVQMMEVDLVVVEKTVIVTGASVRHIYDA